MVESLAHFQISLVCFYLERISYPTKFSAKQEHLSMKSSLEPKEIVLKSSRPRVHDEHDKGRLICITGQAAVESNGSSDGRTGVRKSRRASAVEELAYPTRDDL